MDNITHSLTGVLLSKAGLNRVAPRATLTLLLAANAPDLDIVSAAWGSLAYLRFHRGPTHALVGLPVMAALVTGVVRLASLRAKEKFRWGPTYALALAGAASHTLMDFTNTYGIRPWWPLSGTWSSWDISFIVDPWLWAVMLLALTGPALGRLISREIGARPNSGRAAAIAALAFVLAWWTARDFLHRRSLAMLDSRLYGVTAAASGSDSTAAALPPQRVAAFPNALNPFQWRGFVETRGFYQIIPLRVLEPLDPSQGQIFYKPEPSPVLAAALRSSAASRFSSFARYRFARIEELEEGYRVVFSDWRFSVDRPDSFVCTVDLDPSLRITAQRFSF